MVSPDTWIYLTCPDDTFYDTASNSCLECDDSWKTWYGPLSTNCLNCPYARFINAADHSCQSCKEINPGLTFEQISNTCLERWGKGFNLGFVQCDDGNSKNGDGCDQNCLIETDWSCSGGNATHPDTCISLIGPHSEFTYISSKSHLGSIAFTENVTLGELSEGDVTIIIKGPLSPYEFNYFINTSTGYTEGETVEKFRIQFEFLSSLAGYNKGKNKLL